MGTFLWGLLGAALIAAALWLSIAVAASLGPHCRCGHHKKVHRGRNTECYGSWPVGRNAVGAKQVDPCSCRSYRPTSVRYWRRIMHGTEEQP